MDQKTVLVTGAGSGIGLATVELFLKNDYFVIAHFHSDSSKLKLLQTPSLHLISADFRSSDAVKNLARECLKLRKSVDILVNNAALIKPTKNLEFLTEEDLDEVMQINFKAPLFLAQIFLPAMREKSWGRIINISSIGVKYGGSLTTPHYTISKAALEALTISLNKLVAPHNILVHTVRPGLTDTSLHQKVPQKNLEERKKQIPLGRMGKPEEIANGILFLSQDASSYLTGNILTIAGGE